MVYLKVVVENRIQAQRRLCERDRSIALMGGSSIQKVSWFTQSLDGIIFTQGSLELPDHLLRTVEDQKIHPK